MDEDVLSKLLDKRPEMKTEVEELMPEPDLAPMEERLAYLKRNIYKVRYGG